MRKIRLILLLTLMTGFLFGQEQKVQILPNGNTTPEKKQKKATLTAIYDYENKIYLGGQLKPKHNQPVVLKITNINKLAHDVFITETDVKIKDELLDTDVETVKGIVEKDKHTEDITSEVKSLNIEAPVKIVEESKKRSSGKKDNTKELEANLELNKKELVQLKQRIKGKEKEQSEIEDIIAVLTKEQNNKNPNKPTDGQENNIAAELKSKEESLNNLAIF